MARTYQTPCKSTGGHFPRGQLAPRHQKEDLVEEEPEEVQPEAEIEEDPEEVQPEPEVEEDPEEVLQEDPIQQPQLYDGTVLEADADGDIVIPLAPEGLFGKWRIQVDGRGLKGIVGNFDLSWKFLHPNTLRSRSFH
jgi:hypothetical protein